jgi:putative transposase
MAEGHRMTAAELVDKLMADEHADVLRDSVAWLVEELMNAEVTVLTGAELGERAPGRRQTQRNGYRQRRWDTRVGGLELAIPKLRQGSYFPSLLEPRRRAEQALVAVVQEAYVNGISTRKVDRLVEQLGLQQMSKDTVSRLCRGLDEQVQVFRERPLAGAYPYLWLDAKVERVREPGGVRHKALAIAYGVHETGRREVVGLDVGEAETESFWRAFLRSLRARGLEGVQLVISDAHTGLQSAIAKVFGCPWQRCTVHFLRDMLGHVARAQQPLVSGAIRQIFTAGSAAEARERLGQVADQLRPHAPKVARLLEDAEADLLAFYGFPAEHCPSCAPPTRWSGSTARSAAAPTLSGSSRMMRRCCGWPGCCWWSRTTSGWSAAATCRKPPWPWSWLPPPIKTATGRRCLSSPHHDWSPDGHQLHHQLRLDCSPPP